MVVDTRNIIPSSKIANTRARNGAATMANSTAVAPVRAAAKRRAKPASRLGAEAAARIR